MENKTLNTTCIMCPMGCSLNITQDGTKITVSGNTCDKGKKYGESEIVEPVRILTTLVKTPNKVVPVKTTIAIPKQKIKQAMTEIEQLRPKTTSFGQVLIHNVAGTEADVIVTK